MKFEQEHLFEKGEMILGKVRKHWIVYVEDFLMHFFGCFVFISASIYLASQNRLTFITANESAYGAMILAMIVLIFWTSFFYQWTINYFDVWYVTDKHIVAINQKKIFEREEAFMELVRIQDVSFEKEGFLATLFGYGTLKVQSAGTEQEFIIEYAYDVENDAHHIMNLRDKAKTEAGGEKSEVGSV